MPTARAALILAATALAGAIAGALAVLAFRPDVALLLAVAVWFACDRLWRWRYGIALAALALIVWHHLTRNGDHPK